MSWISFAVFGYFLQAVAVLGDKIILKKVLRRPASYAFWQGILSLGVLIFIPFGFSILPLGRILICLLAGAFWLYGLFFFFTALSKADASNVLPVVLGVTAFLIFLMEALFLGHGFKNTDILAGVFLVFGSISLSLEHRWGHKIKNRGFIAPAVMTAFLFSFSTFLIKYLFVGESFFNVLIWSRFGLLLAGLSFVLVPELRKEIFQDSRELKKSHASGTVVLNKIFGASGTISIYFAISRGPAALVNALQGLQYAFLFLLAFVLSFWIPSLIKESLSAKAVFQKILGIIIISIGLFILYFYGSLA